MMMPMPMPPADELEMLFETFLENLNLPEEKKEVMKKFPDARKWDIVQQQMNEQQEDEETAEDEIQADLADLKETPNKELLQSLSVSLRSKPIHWINKFVELGGINALWNYQRDITPQHRYSILDLIVFHSFIIIITIIN
jgi:hypothetical protein